MGLLPDTQNSGLRMHREFRERFLATVGKRSRHASRHVRDALLTSGFLWSRRRGKHSRHSRGMRNPQFYVSGKRPMSWRLHSKLPYPSASSSTSAVLVSTAASALATMASSSLATIVAGQLSTAVYGCNGENARRNLTVNKNASCNIFLRNWEIAISHNDILAWKTFCIIDPFCEESTDHR